jgi:polysaccharide biosynthesis protein PslG
MLRGSSRRSALLILGMIALSACGAGAGGANTASSDATVNSSSAAALALSAGSALAAGPAVAAGPALASGSAAASRSATARAAQSKRATTKAGTPSASASAAGSSTPTVPGATAAPGGTVYGMSDPDLIGESPDAQVQTLEQMKAIGITSVRVDASWYWGQPTEGGPFDWTPLDQVVASLRKVGLSVDLDINQTPAWAGISSAGGSSWAQPASAAAFAAWAGAVAARYGPEGVQLFEIWNEPNLVGSWEPTPDPAAYTADLKAAYAAIKAADPSAIVISGGLAPAANTSTSYDPRTFLEDMYADGAGGSFDGVGDHPYSYPATPDEFESWSGWSLMDQTSPSLRSIMAANGDSGKKIWITEFGAPTVGGSSVGDAGESTDLVEAIDQARSTSWIGSLYIYTWEDVTTDASNGFGVLNSDATQKPAYSAVADALHG